MSKESAFTSKNPLSTSIDEKFVDYSISIGHSTSSSSSIVLSSTYYSSSESLIMTNVGAGGENYFWKPCNVSSNPSPTIATHFYVSKISHYVSLSCLEPSLLFQNTRGDLDANGSM